MSHLTATIGVKGHIPVISLILHYVCMLVKALYPYMPYRPKNVETESVPGDTHSIDVARLGLVLGRSIAPVRDTSEGTGNIIVKSRRLLEVELVSVPVRVRARGVAGLGASGDGDSAAARLLQRDGTVDGGLPDLLVGGAGGLVAVGAAAAGGGRDAGRLELRLSLGLGELLRSNQGGEKSGEKHGDLEEG